MPTYVCAAAAGRLTPVQKTEIARRIAAIHFEETGAPRYLVQVIFYDVALDSHYVAGRPATEPLSQVARLMAERTTQSWTSVPHFFLVQSVDAGALIDTQKKLSQESVAGSAPTITDVLIGLLARVLEKHPRMNSSWTGDGIRPNADINISVAMAVKDGVVGAVIPKANKEKIVALSVLRRELTERARAGRLRPTDISGGTFTLSNLGMYKVNAFSAIITPPQCAILAVGAIADAVVPVDGKPGIRPIMILTLSSDHRVVDGARAAEFLVDLVNAICEPEKWL